MTPRGRAEDRPAQAWRLCSGLSDEVTSAGGTSVPLANSSELQKVFSNAEAEVTCRSPRSELRQDAKDLDAAADGEGGASGGPCSGGSNRTPGRPGTLQNAAHTSSGPPLSCSPRAILHSTVEEFLLRSNKRERSSKQGFKRQSGNRTYISTALEKVEEPRSKTVSLC